jgi:hypothetical protein
MFSYYLNMVYGIMLDLVKLVDHSSSDSETKRVSIPGY